MTLPFHNILISSVQLRISLLQNTRPDLVFLLTLSEHIVIVLVDWQVIIDHHEEFLSELEETHHVGAFLVYPTLLALGLETKGWKDPFLAEDAQRAD